MLIGIINNKIEELIFKDIQHVVSVELRSVCAQCEDNNDVPTVENQEDVLNQVMARSITKVKKDYSEPVNARLQHLLEEYTRCLCLSMIHKIVEVSNRDGVKYGWPGLADYYLLIMYGEADKIKDKIESYRENKDEKEDASDAE